jgi:large subunit ribosomal protein L40
MESRALLFKDWSRHMGQERMKDIQIIDMVMTSQLKALEELRLESEELYQAAIQV